MNPLAKEEEYLLKSTRSSFLWTRLLNVPFYAILSLLPLILYKEMKITALQIAAAVALKPLSALLASYWSVSIHKRQDRLNSNIVWANLLRYFPFLFFPWIESTWLMIFAFGSYMTLNRGVVPAWMEIFKRNIRGETREKVFAYGSTLDYLGPAILPLAIGVFLDDFNHSWRWLFFGTACLGIFSTYFLYKLPPIPIKREELFLAKPLTWIEKIKKPWEQSWELLKSRRDFAKFQIGFMFGGAGLMVIASTLPMFFVDVLHLSYTAMALAIALCKGIGFVSTTPLWIKLFRRIDLYSFSSLVTLLAALFPIFLLGAKVHVAFLYSAYLLYGFMQAGSELGWHMSGPVFAKDEESSLFSQTNVLSVGVRGCFAPFLGSLLYSYSNSTVVMVVGGLLCLIAAEKMGRYGRALKTQPANLPLPID